MKNINSEPFWQGGNAIYKVDLNSDLGESFGTYQIGLDEEVIAHVSSVNIACGFHAGDPLTMEKTVATAKARRTAVGAHPGFPDLLGFGRRNMVCTQQEVKAYVKYQLGALTAFARSYGVRLQHCKPHGALYNMAGKDSELASAIAQAIAEVDSSIILLGLSGSKMVEAGRQVGLQVACEVFADRAYQANGSLVPRSLPGAVIHNAREAATRAVRMVKEGKVTSVTGEDIDVEAHSICVHGDNPAAIMFVKEIRARLEAENISVAPISQVLAQPQMNGPVRFS